MDHQVTTANPNVSKNDDASASNDNAVKWKCNFLKSHSALISSLLLLFVLLLFLLFNNNVQGRVRNPTGEGVRAISSQVKAKTAKNNAAAAEAAKQDDHETKVKEGTAKRNITRKKTADKESGKYNSAFKKQGGHGKGEWKEMLDPSYVEDLPLDENDPLYDAAEDSDRYVLTSGNEDADKRGYDPGTSKPVFGPLLTLQEFKFQLNECMREYFDSCDADEVIRTLEELGCQEYLMEVPKKAISLALDMGPRERELVSRLLTCLHPTPLSMGEMEDGFNALLDGLDELSTDVPEAKVCTNKELHCIQRL